MKSRRTFALWLFLFAAVVMPLSTDAESVSRPRRVALVVGNGAYSVNPLRNPPNDAEDIAAALKEAEFDVMMVKDADLVSFEKAVNEFSAGLTGADTGLFYYAGHGVQVDGMNYLIPISPRIDDMSSVKARAVSVDMIVGKMETSGVRTALVFLDSCRNNPFPGSVRSGSRGLAVVATPRTVNSLIAFATSPGEVADDGDGRNGVFSGAFLEQLRRPGQELSEMMRTVKAEVARSTGNRQQPRVDDGMKEGFYFVSPDELAVRVRKALEAGRAEVARLERELAERQALIDAARDAREKQSLEVEQQRQQALATARRIENENLAREADRRRREADEKAAALKIAADRSRRQSELVEIAATRRAELERLAESAASDNPDILIETVERLEVVLREVDKQFADALQRSLSAADEGWALRLIAVETQKPDITETDREFKARVHKERDALGADRRADLENIRREAEAERTAQTRAMRGQFDSALRTLKTKVWIVKGSAVSLEVGDFDRNARIWPFTVGSWDPVLPMTPVTVTADLNRTPDPRAAIFALDTAVKAGALTGEVDWGITRDAENSRFGVDIRAVRVRNLTTEDVVAEARPNQRAAYFTAGRRASPTGLATLIVTSRTEDGVGEVLLNGSRAGTTPYTARVPEGSYALEVRWGDDPYKVRSQNIQIKGGEIVEVSSLFPPSYRVHGKGPAGGLIFFDKGSVSNGWRYLEAAPLDTHLGIHLSGIKYWRL